MLRSLLQSYKNAYTGLSKSSWMLSLVMLINRSGTMVVPFMSVYLIQKLNFTLVQSGWVMALFGVGSLGGAFLGGKLTDRIGFYNVQIGALLTGGTLFIVLGYQHTFTSIGIVTLILSLCNESFRPANSAAIAHYSNESNKTRSYSLNRLAVNLGWAVGGGLGGFLASVNYQLLFWVDGLTNVFAAMLVLTLMPRPRLNPKENKVPDFTATSVSAYKDGTYLFFIVLTTLFSCCFYEFFITQPVFYTLQWHFSERFIGFLLVSRQTDIVGYSFLSLILASSLVNCQLMVAFLLLRCVCQAVTSFCIFVMLLVLRFKHCPIRTFNSISAIFSQLPCLGV